MKTYRTAQKQLQQLKCELAQKSRKLLLQHEQIQYLCGELEVMSKETAIANANASQHARLLAQNTTLHQKVVALRSALRESHTHTNELVELRQRHELLKARTYSLYQHQKSTDPSPKTPAPNVVFVFTTTQVVFVCLVCVLITCVAGCFLEKPMAFTLMPSGTVISS